MKTINLNTDLSAWDREMLIKVLMLGVNSFAERHGWDSPDTEEIDGIVEELVKVLEG